MLVSEFGLFPQIDRTQQILLAFLVVEFLLAVVANTDLPFAQLIGANKQQIVEITHGFNSQPFLFD